MAIIGDYIFYVQEKIECSLLTSKNYISTENMQNNAKGVYESSTTPTDGKCCKYVEGDILLSNIRPYFRKVWFADKVGGCSNDVLCFRNNKNLILNKYVFYILSSQRFIDYVVSTSKGTKMPRGDKSSILKYGVKIPSLSIQQEIIDIIKPVEELFLKYSSLVRIDNADNCEKDVSNLIDIIEPLESAINILEKIIKTKESMFHLKETGESLNDYAQNTNTGYSYSKNDYVGTGKFKVFTIKNISGSTTFERTNIIKNNVLQCGDTITGMSGTIGTATVITDEGHVSNQRTFAFSSDFPVQSALSIELQAKKLINLSTGAVQKNITKDNILNLSFCPFFSKQYDDSIILELKIKQMLTAILEKTVKLLIK